MCCGCWNNDGSPKIDNPAVRAALKAVERVYDFNGVGGNLHVQLDDNNLDDEFFEEFKPFWPEDQTEDGQIEAETECFYLLKALTYEERLSVLGLWDGCWTLN